jgi:hypothetical protein
MNKIAWRCFEEACVCTLLRSVANQLTALFHFHINSFLFPDKIGTRRLFFLTLSLDLIRFFFLWGKVAAPTTIREGCTVRASLSFALFH